MISQHSITQLKVDQSDKR